MKKFKMYISYCVTKAVDVEINDNINTTFPSKELYDEMERQGKKLVSEGIMNDLSTCEISKPEVIDWEEIK